MAAADADQPHLTARRPGHPFAFRRGLSFEKLLRADSYAATLAVLREEMRYTEAGLRVANLRETHPVSAASMPLLTRRARDTMAPRPRPGYTLALFAWPMTYVMPR